MLPVGEEGIEPVNLWIKNPLHYRLCYSPDFFLPWDTGLLALGISFQTLARAIQSDSWRKGGRTCRVLPSS